jgi:hypothetical protein
MTGIRLELADPDDYPDLPTYIEQHVAPVAAELHRLANELFSPGSTAEELAVDMMPKKHPGSDFSRLDRRVDESPKHVIFDGSEYFSLPKELLRSKQAKVQFVATVYVKGGGGAEFRLVRDDGMVIENSLFYVSGSKLQTRSYIVPFGEHAGCITPDSRTYFIEGGMATTGSLPVCRRFSLSFVYI